MTDSPEDGADPAIAALDRMFTAVAHGPDSRAMHRQAREQAGVDLDRPGYTLLLRVATQGGTRMSTLAEALGLDLSTVSRKVAQLEGQGLLERGPDPDDARAVLVDLTGAGRTAMRTLRDARRSRLTAAIAHWPAADRDQLGVLVDRLLEDLIAFKQRVPHVEDAVPAPPAAATEGATS